MFQIWTMKSVDSIQPMMPPPLHRMPMMIPYCNHHRHHYCHQSNTVHHYSDDDDRRQLEYHHHRQQSTCSTTRAVESLNLKANKHPQIYIYTCSQKARNTHLTWIRASKLTVNIAHIVVVVVLSRARWWVGLCRMNIENNCGIDESRMMTMCCGVRTATSSSILKCNRDKEQCVYDESTPRMTRMWNASTTWGNYL